MAGIIAGMGRRAAAKAHRAAQAAMQATKGSGNMDVGADILLIKVGEVNAFVNTKTTRTGKLTRRPMQNCGVDNRVEKAHRTLASRLRKLRRWRLDKYVR